jgi:hypothetical protein
VVAEVKCPECQSPRTNASTTTCATCGAPPIREGDQRATEEEVRTQDLEPYSTLTYIARLFKVLAVIIAILLIAEIVLGIGREGVAALGQLLTEITQLLVLAGGLWGVGDLTLLAIDAGHDLRVARILLGRINAELHRKGAEDDKKKVSAG